MSQKHLYSKKRRFATLPKGGPASYRPEGGHGFLEYKCF